MHKMGKISQEMVILSSKSDISSKKWTFYARKVEFPQGNDHFVLKKWNFFKEMTILCTRSDISFKK